MSTGYYNFYNYDDVRDRKTASIQTLRSGEKVIVLRVVETEIVCQVIGTDSKIVTTKTGLASYFSRISENGCTCKNAYLYGCTCGQIVG